MIGVEKYKWRMTMLLKECPVTKPVYCYQWGVRSTLEATDWYGLELAHAAQ